MPGMICPNCNKVTNTAVADHMGGTGCYAYYEGGKWHKGCIYKTGGDFLIKDYVNRELLGEAEWK